MAVGFDASSESHTGTTGSTSQASFSWTHTPSGTPRGVLIFVFGASSATVDATSVTYGGTTVPAVSGAQAADTATEPGFCKAFFLGAGLGTGAKTVVVNRNNNANVLYAVAITVTAGADTVCGGAVLLQEDGTLAEQNVDDGSPGVNSMRFAGVYSGLASPPAAGANSTALQSIDLGANGCATVRETTAGQGSRPVGFSSATSDDRAAVHVFVGEVVNATITAPAAAATGSNPLSTSSATEGPLAAAATAASVAALALLTLVSPATGATAAAPAPSLSIASNVTIVAPAATATAASTAPVIRDTIVAPAAAATAASTPPAVSSGTNVTIAAPAASASAAAAVTAGIDELRTLRVFDAGGISGTFTLTFQSQTTTSIAYNANAAAVQSALEALSNLDPGDVICTDLALSAGDTLKVSIEFTGRYGAQDIVTGDLSTNSSLIGGGISLSNTQNGVPSTIHVTPVAPAAAATGASTAPTLAITGNATITAPAASATAASTAPVVHETIIAPGSAATAASTAPAVSAGGSITVVAPAATASAGTPLSTSSATEGPTAAAATATAPAPTVTVSGGVTIIAPPATATAIGVARGSIAESGLIWLLQGPATPTIVITLLPGAAAATAQSVAPAVSSPGNVTVVSPAASATAASTAPVLRETLISPAASGTAASQAPVLRLTIVTPAGAATAVGAAPVVAEAGALIAPPATATAQAAPPVVSISQTVVAPAASANAQSTAPAAPKLVILAATASAEAHGALPSLTGVVAETPPGVWSPFVDSRGVSRRQYDPSDTQPRLVPQRPGRVTRGRW